MGRGILLLHVKKDGSFPAAGFGLFLFEKCAGKRVKKHSDPPPDAIALLQMGALFMGRLLFDLIDPVYPGMNGRIFTAFNTLCGNYV
ncbi:MAG: hypothetical protein LBB83_08555 [Treponema sp.]|nr:hypothetical protein [Treponema sp.]